MELIERCSPGYLWQLLGDPPEHMVVQVPGLGQILHVARPLILPTPVLSLHQVPAIGLNNNTNMFKLSWLLTFKLNEISFACFTCQITPVSMITDLIK